MLRKRLSIGGAGLNGIEDELVAVELRGRVEATEAGEEEFCGGRGGEADVGAPPATGSCVRRWLRGVAGLVCNVGASLLCRLQRTLVLILLLFFLSFTPGLIPFRVVRILNGFTCKIALPSLIICTSR
jgi:hypothetical protein